MKGWNVPDAQKPYRNMFVIVWFLTIIFVLVDTYYDQKNRPKAPDMPYAPQINDKRNKAP